VIRRLKLIVTILALARPEPVAVGVLALVLLLQTLPDLGMPLQMGRALDGLTTGAHAQVVAGVAIYAAFGLLSVASSVWFSTASLRVVRNIQASLGALSFRKMQRRPLAFLRDTSHGEIISRLTTDLDAVSNTLTNILLPFVRAAALFVLGAAIMLRMNWMLALGALAFAPLWIVAIRPGADRLSAIRRVVVERFDRVNHVVSERLTYLGVARAKTFGAYETDLNAYRSAVDGVTEASLRFTRRNAFIMMEVNAVGLIAGQALLLFLGVWLAARRLSTPGEIVAFMGLQSRLFAPLNTLTNLHMQLASNETVFERVLALLRADDEPSGTRSVTEPRLGFRVRQLERDGRIILENVAEELDSGAWIGIAGRSGSGKTTLALAISALEAIPGIEITLGGTRLEELDTASVRRTAIVVPQHDTLFADTVAANLAYGIEPSDDELRRVLRLVELSERFPTTESLNENVGELGSRLSGGERQRLALARALLHRPAILVLDEALSGVDLSSEQRIIERIRSEHACTLVTITHRTKTLEGCDRVIVLGGEVPGAAEAADAVL
jgi:ABC-type multidrug transport system fused ATPase/permease subunit